MHKNAIFPDQSTRLTLAQYENYRKYLVTTGRLRDDALNGNPNPLTQKWQWNEPTLDALFFSPGGHSPLQLENEMVVFTRYNQFWFQCTNIRASIGRDCRPQNISPGIPPDEVRVYSGERWTTENRVSDNWVRVTPERWPLVNREYLKEAGV